MTHVCKHAGTLPAKRRLHPRLGAMCLLYLVSMGLPLAVFADNLTRDGGSKSLQGVTDVTGGLTYILQNDDVSVLQMTQSGNTYTTKMWTVDTHDSTLSQNPGEIHITSTDPQGYTPQGGVPIGEGVGRMFNGRGDTVTILNEGDGPSWLIHQRDIVSGFHVDNIGVVSKFAPYGQVYTQVVTGNFIGDRYADPLIFYLSLQDGVKVEWGIKLLTAADRSTEAAPVQGPEFYGKDGLVPVTGSITVGDFSGDGKDEFALLLTDWQTIVFYQVDAKTLAISEITRYTLPHKYVANQVSLSAGHFRNTSNAEIVVFGQVENNQSNGFTIDSIAISPTNNGSLNVSLAQTGTPFGQRPTASIAIARTVSLFNPVQMTAQQIVLGISPPFSPLELLPSYIEIGSFCPDFSFTWQSESSFAPYWPIYDLQVGNFDNLNQHDFQHSPSMELAAYTRQNGYQHVTIFSINPPPGTQGCTAAKKSMLARRVKGDSLPDWLVQTSDLKFGDEVDGGFGPFQIIPADLQGRSLRLGPPEIVGIPQQVQADMILGIPPMHIDWIAPHVNYLNPDRHPGCESPEKPCVLNLSVLPSMPAPNIGFSTGFNFSSQQFTDSARKSTTSWGVSVKLTLEQQVSFGDELEGGSVDMKESAQYVHDHNVAKTYDTYQGVTSSVSATTGFADHVFYTYKGMNVYYYPVLGVQACNFNDKHCDNKLPAYIEFSVPDQVTHADLDGTSLEWYQPVHEPGNVLSYPWSSSQLEGQFTNTATPLTTDPAPCRGIDTSQTSYTTQWTGTNKQSNSTGSSNSFSSDISISASAHAGVQDAFGGGTSATLDVGGSTSLSTLNETTTSLSASTGITVSKPAFDSDISQCCSYLFSGYILGQTAQYPAWQNLNFDDPQGNPLDISAAGPMSVEFLTDAYPNPGDSCGGGGNPDWWRQVYHVADVGVNHPARWQWSKSTQTASFNAADRSGQTSPLDQPFYQMKGFFITKTTDTGPTGTLTDVVAGDQLQLTARVYNFSLVDTNSAQLRQPAESVHVRFYGQKFCQSGLGSEPSCLDQNQQTCQPATLCGVGFILGEDKLASIPGYKSLGTEDSPPNWITAAINFDTTHYANYHLVFWVVTWMEDGKGNLIAEMPGHGLTAPVDSQLVQQITDIPTEAYSNNVGLYGVNTPLTIEPANTFNAGVTPITGYLQSINLTAPNPIALDARTKLSLQLRAAGAPVGPVNIAYYDGAPDKGGRLLDLQQISRMEPNVDYQHRAFFSPDACGLHHLYAWAWLNDSPGIFSSFDSNVSLDTIAATNALISATKGTEMLRELRPPLVAILNAALAHFQQHKNSEGVLDLQKYKQKLATYSGKGITAERANRLIGQADVIVGCVVLARNVP